MGPGCGHDTKGGTSQGDGIDLRPEGDVHVAGLLTYDIDFSGDGTAEVSTPSFAWFTARYGPVTTAVDPPEALDALELHVSPMPFGDEARVTLSARAGQHVRVEVFDLLGRSVALLYDGPATSERLYLEGRALAAGPYLLRATAGGASVAEVVTHMPGFRSQ